MPTSYIYNLARFPKGNAAEIDISVKVYRQFILSLQGIAWFSFPCREEWDQQSCWLSGGNRKADAHTTLLTLTAMGSPGSDLGGTPLPFPLATLQKMVRASTLPISRVQSALGFPSFFRSPTCCCSWLVRIQWNMSKESSGVFSEPVSLPYASLPSVYLHLKHCWRLDGGCQIRRWIARKLGLVGTQRSCLFVPSALCHDQLYPSPSWQRDKHLSNLFQCFPCSLFCSPCSFFLILLLSQTFSATISCAMGTEDSFFPSPYTAFMPGDFLLPFLCLPSSSYTAPLISVFSLQDTCQICDHSYCPPLGTLQWVHLKRQFQNWAQHTN